MFIYVGEKEGGGREKQRERENEEKNMFLIISFFYLPGENALHKIKVSTLYLNLK
jgi:hypothetical protein